MADNDPFYGRYVVMNTLHGSIEMGCRVEAKDFKSGFICLLCLERDFYKGSENPGEFETTEDLIKHVEKEHTDLAYTLECFMRISPNQAKMIV